MVKLNGVTYKSESVNAKNIVPLMAGFPSYVLTFGWIVYALLFETFISGVYVTLSWVTHAANCGVPAEVLVT